MILLYPDRPGVLPGSVITFHVSTGEDGTPFHIQFYRQGKELAYMGSSAEMLGYSFRGNPAPTGSPDADWNWPGYDIRIPDDWPSGAYIALAVEGDNPAPHPYSPYRDSAMALFVVKSANPGHNASILYKIPLATYIAYNYTGGGNLYDNQRWSASDNPPGYKVNLLRPGGGTGGWIRPLEPLNEDLYDLTTHSPRQTFAHWDAEFIRWLETNGYAVDYCTDLDVHEDSASLTSYRLMLSVGHDEYWSPEMRAQVESFIEHGGNVAFLSGNTCWWRIHFTDDRLNANTGRQMATAFTCDKVNCKDQWWTNDPENRMIGASYRNGGGWWTGPRQQLGYTIQHADHWVFAGTGLQDGDVLGYEDYLAGYECDGAYYQVDAAGLAHATGTDGTPGNFTILGVAILDDHWMELPPRELEHLGPHAATMGVYTRGGTVFTAATVDWVRVVTGGQDRRVAQITSNVLNRLQGLL